MDHPDLIAWPDLLEEDRWLITEMEERIRESKWSSEELAERARELRAQAGETDIKGFREASLALASRYEAAAATRLKTR